MVRIATPIALSLLLATPAYAQASVPLPAPDALTLLSLGLLGVIVGRRAASRRDNDGE